MRRLSRGRGAAAGIAKSVDKAGSCAVGRPCLALFAAGCGAVISIVFAAICAPPAVADHSASLKSALAAARGSGCPALQQNPALDRLALRANSEMQSYAQHTARFIPFETQQLIPLLQEMGYDAGKAKLLVGYGDSVPRGPAFRSPEGNAIHGVIIEGYEFLPDCGFTEFGASIVENRSEGYVLAATILAGP